MEVYSVLNTCTMLFNKTNNNYNNTNRILVKENNKLYELFFLHFHHKFKFYKYFQRVF